MAKRKTETRRDSSPGVPPATVPGGGGHAGRRATRGKAGRAADPPTAEFLEELDTFAKRLKASMHVVGRFHWNFLETDNNWAVTKKAGTRFSNRAEKLATEVRALAGVFPTLVTKCPDDELCRCLISTLDGSLPEMLVTIADELDRIAARARQPLTVKEKGDLFDDLRSLHRTVEAVLTAAEWIEDEVKVIKGASLQGRGTRAPLPREIEELLSSVEREARRFTTAVGRYRGGEPGGFESAIEFLGQLDEGRRRLDKEAEGFATTLRKFSDSHREMAEKGGHEQFVRFLDGKEDVLRRLATRRRVGASLLSGLIAAVKHRLSYGDDSTTIYAVDRILYMLQRYESHLQAQLDVCDFLVRQAADKRAAAAVRESDLPEWDDIVRAKSGDGRKLHGLDLLVAAFRDAGDDGPPPLVPSTKAELKERLDDLLPTKRPFSDSWVDRRLKDAIKRGIVVQLPRPEGQSKTLPDRFQVSDAAVRKYAL